MVIMHAIIGDIIIMHAINTNNGAVYSVWPCKVSDLPEQVTFDMSVVDASIGRVNASGIMPPVASTPRTPPVSAAATPTSTSETARTSRHRGHYGGMTVNTITGISSTVITIGSTLVSTTMAANFTGPGNQPVRNAGSTVVAPGAGPPWAVPSVTLYLFLEYRLVGLGDGHAADGRAR